VEQITDKINTLLKTILPKYQNLAADIYYEIIDEIDKKINALARKKIGLQIKIIF
jgi:hypothetical protein